MTQCLAKKRSGQPCPVPAYWFTNYGPRCGKHASTIKGVKFLVGRRKDTHKESPKGTGTGKATTEYRIWDGLKGRCLNPNNKDYPNYGGRGITVCEKWRNNFSAFLADVGRKPSSGYSLDRIKNDGNYEPGNVRWASWSEQRRNRPPNQPRRVCPSGHAMTPENTRIWRGLRMCRICQRARYLRWKDKKARTA